MHPFKAGTGNGKGAWRRLNWVPGRLITGIGCAQRGGSNQGSGSWQRWMGTPENKACLKTNKGARLTCTRCVVPQWHPSSAVHQVTSNEHVMGMAISSHPELMCWLTAAQCPTISSPLMPVWCVCCVWGPSTAWLPQTGLSINYTWNVDISPQRHLFSIQHGSSACLQDNAAEAGAGTALAGTALAGRCGPRGASKQPPYGVARNMLVQRARLSTAGGPRMLLAGPPTSAMH